MKLNLGCGIFPLEGYQNHDRHKHHDYVDLAFDLDIQPYPLVSNTYDEIRAHDVLEHLRNVIFVMDEIHRLLKPGGIFDCKVCGYKNVPNFHKDITHQRAFDVQSMDLFDPSTRLGQELDYYTPNKWEIIKKWEERNNPYFLMKPCK